jgi:hypothetical protein
MTRFTDVMDGGFLRAPLKEHCASILPLSRRARNAVPLGGATKTQPRRITSHGEREVSVRRLFREMGLLPRLPG